MIKENKLTFEQEVLSKPVGQQGQAIINRLERLIKESKESLNKIERK